MATEEAARPEGAYERLIREILAEYFAEMDHDGEVVDTDGATMHDVVVSDWIEFGTPTAEALYKQLGVADAVLEDFMSVAQSINQPLYTALHDCRERVRGAREHIRERWERS